MSDSLWALKGILRATVSRLVPVVVPHVVGTGPAKSDHQQLDPHQTNPLAWLSLAEVEESAVPSLDVAVHEEGLPGFQGSIVLQTAESKRMLSRARNQI